MTRKELDQPFGELVGGLEEQTVSAGLEGPPQRPAGGERVELKTAPAVDSGRWQAQPLDLVVIHQDAHLLVVDKHVGLVVHPGAGNPDGTLVNALLHHSNKLSSEGGALRPGIVHRLDRDTSGLMTVALTDMAHRHLYEQLQDRRMGRTYLTVSWGRWKEDEDTLSGDIGRHPRFRQKMAVVTQGGKHAVSRYRVLEDFGFVQMCEVQLETGRTHQIRVHGAAIGHPVAGDRRYGDELRDPPGLKRLFLHAAELSFIHPLTDSRVSYRAALDPALESVLQTVRLTA